jgi:nicotinamidase-related amidase
MREGSDRNFQCLLIEDACASGDPRAHDAAVYITIVENGLIGLVSQAKDVISGLRALEK